MKNFYTAALFLAGVSLAQAQVFETTDYAFMTDVSNNGVAVGNVMYTSHIMWTEQGGTSAIGVPASGDEIGGNTSISADGRYIAATMTNPETMSDEMARYDVTTGAWTYTGAIAPGMEVTSWGMSIDGSIIVGLGFVNGMEAHAVKWTEGGLLEDLGSTNPETSSRANGVNNDGSIVVGWQDDDLDRNGAYWNKGEQVYLRDSSGAHVGEIEAVSGNGKTMIGHTFGWPYIWTEEEGYTEFPPDDVMAEGGASAVTEDGQTVVGYYRPWGQGAFAGTGFIWTKAEGMKDLNSYVESLGLDNNGMVFSLPLGISPNGKYIVGIGMKANDVKGFVIKLPTELSTAETATKTKYAVYPNPVKDRLFIQNPAGITHAELYNMAGQKVLSTKTVTKDGIDVSKLGKGNYVLKVTGPNHTETVKVLKN